MKKYSSLYFFTPVPTFLLCWRLVPRPQTLYSETCFKTDESFALNSLLILARRVECSASESKRRSANGPKPLDYRRGTRNPAPRTIC